MVMVKTKKEGENYHDRHAVLYLGFTLTVLGRQVLHLKEIKHIKKKMKMSKRCVLQTRHGEEFTSRREIQQNFQTTT